MITRTLSIDSLSQHKLLEELAVCEHPNVAQVGEERWHSTTPGDSYLVERLSVRSDHVLNHNVAVDEVGADPGRVKGRASTV